MPHSTHAQVLWLIFLANDKLIQTDDTIRKSLEEPDTTSEEDPLTNHPDANQSWMEHLVRPIQSAGYGVPNFFRKSQTCQASQGSNLSVEYAFT